MVAFAQVLMLLSCAGGAPADLPVHTLAFGGDFMLGRQLNEAVLDPAARSKVLGQVEILRTADLTLINGEGTITQGGVLVAKGEDSPNTWRVAPAAVDMLVDAGVDVVTMANNHAGDYGPDVVREGVQRLRLAGIDVTGAGLDADDARTPVYRLVGDTVVAFVGIDLTHVRAYAAAKDRPGTFALSVKPKDVDATVKALGKVLEEARKHAHVVLLTPHWGPNWREEPLPELRTLAGRLLDAGFDGILGHSAHTHQGVELVDGKPVIYDAGNLGIPHGGNTPAHRGMLYEIQFTRAGITAVTGYPLNVRPNNTTVATGKVADRILGEWDARTKALGTTFQAIEGGRRVVCDPGRISGPSTALAPARRTASTVEPAPTFPLLDAIPADATPARVRWANGLELVGYHLLVPAVNEAKTAQVVTLYLRATAPLPRDVAISLNASSGTDTHDESHWPGDWAIPGDEFPVGPIVVDRSLLSYEVPPERGVRFGVQVGGAPVESDLPVENGYVVLGASTFDPNAPSIKKILPRPEDLDRAKAAVAPG